MQVNQTGAHMEPSLNLLIAEVEYLESNKAQMDGKAQTLQSERLPWF